MQNTDVPLAQSRVFRLSASFNEFVEDLL